MRQEGEVRVGGGAARRALREQEGCNGRWIINEDGEIIASSLGKHVNFIERWTMPIIYCFVAKKIAEGRAISLFSILSTNRAAAKT